MINNLNIVLLFTFVSCTSQNFNDVYTFKNNYGELVHDKNFTSFATLDFADQKIPEKKIIRVTIFKTDSLTREILIAEDNEQDRIDSLATLGLLIEVYPSDRAIDLTSSKKIKEIIFIYDNSQLKEMNFSKPNLKFINGKYFISELGVFITPPSPSM